MKLLEVLDIARKTGQRFRPVSWKNWEFTIAHGKIQAQPPLVESYLESGEFDNIGPLDIILGDWVLI